MTTTRWQVRRARRKRHVAPCLLGYEQLSGRPSVPVSRVSGEGFSPFTKIAEEPTLYYQKQRLSRALEPRLRAVIEHNISELNGFARSLGQDKGAVLAPLTLSWSNGQVEGQVNRLKLIKRQMYGRAQLDLLPLRALAPSGP